MYINRRLYYLYNTSANAKLFLKKALKIQIKIQPSQEMSKLWDLGK